MRAVDSNGQYSKIDKNTILTGTINAKTDIRIDGTLDGDLITTGKVIIGKDHTRFGGYDTLNDAKAFEFNHQLL